MIGLFDGGVSQGQRVMSLVGTSRHRFGRQPGLSLNSASVRPQAAQS